MIDKGQGKSFARAVNACWLGEECSLGERNYMACCTEDRGV